MSGHNCGMQYNTEQFLFSQNNHGRILIYYWVCDSDTVWSWRALWYSCSGCKEARSCRNCHQSFPSYSSFAEIFAVCRWSSTACIVGLSAGQNTDAERGLCNCSVLTTTTQHWRLRNGRLTAAFWYCCWCWVFSSAFGAWWYLVLMVTNSECTHLGDMENFTMNTCTIYSLL